MPVKPGTINHAKGFVVNKLYEQKRFGGSHVPVAFLSQGYPPKWRHLIADAIDSLKNEGIILVTVKRTGRDTANHASMSKHGLSQARGLLNAFRKSENLPRLGKDLKTLLPQ
jgi:hypothetical protein